MPAVIRSILSSIAVLALVLGAAACEKTTHDNIDKWMTSKKGLGKLKSALSSSSIDPDLSAHAAENLLRKTEEEAVRKAFEAMNPQRREQVIAKLAPRLWNMARIEGEMSRPTPTQEVAKDALFELRGWADAPTRDQIDGYLTDWLTGGYFEGRAMAGRHQGVQIIRALGAKAGERLIAETNRLIAAPDKDGARTRIGDQLLLGLAASGSPDAVKLLLEIFGMERGDDTLPDRAMGALYRAYLDPQGLFDLVDPAALVPSIPRLADIAGNDRNGAQTNNDAVQLIRATGMPSCLEPLLSLVNHPHRDPRFRWVGVNNALRCGGPAALGRLGALLPTGASYDADVIGGATWQAVPAIGQRDAFIAAAKAMLADKSWVSRWIAIETLATLHAKDAAAQVAALGNDRTRLTGYRGEQDDVPRGDRKPDPTLGERAREIAKGLQ